MSFPLLVLVEAVLMENGEIIHLGKSLGFCSKAQMSLVKAGATKLPRPKTPVINIGNVNPA